MAEGGSNTVMAAELVFERLARKLNVPVPPGEVVRIPQSLIDRERHRYEELSSFAPGDCFGSLEIPINTPGVNRAALTQLLKICTNLHKIPGIVLLDYWTWNVDRGRAIRSNYGNVIYTMDQTGRRVVAIDHGHAFGGRSKKVKIYAYLEKWITGAKIQYYRAFKGYLDRPGFTPFINRMNKIKRGDITMIMDEIPESWGVSQAKKQKWGDFLWNRKDKVATQIDKQFVYNRDGN